MQWTVANNSTQFGVMWSGDHMWLDKVMSQPQFLICTVNLVMLSAIVWL
jgi:hypothetical protein